MGTDGGVAEVAASTAIFVLALALGCACVQVTANLNL